MPHALKNQMTSAQRETPLQMARHCHIFTIPRYHISHHPDTSLILNAMAFDQNCLGLGIIFGLTESICLSPIAFRNSLGRQIAERFSHMNQSSQANALPMLHAGSAIRSAISCKGISQTDYVLQAVLPKQTVTDQLLSGTSQCIANIG